MSIHLPYIHGFNMLRCIGPKSFEKLGLYFSENFQRAWTASETELQNAGIAEEITKEIIEKRKKIDPEIEYEKLEKSGIRFIGKQSEEYPILLKEIPTAPYALYIRGNFIADEFSIAVVGTRKPTRYGTEACKNISDVLTVNNITITSGLAFGIDGIAHQSAVNGKKRTIAILGSGIDEKSIYPSTHIRLANNILKNGGAIASEFPPETPALPHHFPQRNRIVAGMTKGTVVIEAKEKSGALITARLALEYNRDVFAVPGSIFSLASAGPHALIKEGAELIHRPEDILLSYHIQQKSLPFVENFTDTELRIMSLLENPLSLEELRLQSGLDISILNATLSMLELKKSIIDTGNKTYVTKK